MCIVSCCSCVLLNLKQYKISFGCLSLTSKVVYLLFYFSFLKVFIYKCLPFRCEQRGEAYFWCNRVIDGGWGYCSPDTVYREGTQCILYTVAKLFPTPRNLCWNQWEQPLCAFGRLSEVCRLPKICLVSKLPYHHYQVCLVSERTTRCFQMWRNALLWLHSPVMYFWKRCSLYCSTRCPVILQ